MLTIRQHATAADPLRLFNFLVTIPNPPGGGNGQILQGRTQTGVLPGSTIESIPVTRQGHTIKVPGIRNYERQFNVQFEETENFDILKILEAWEALVCNRETGATAPSSQFKTTILIELMKNDKTIGRRYRVHGSYLKAIADTPLGGDDNSTLKITATFRYDFVVPA